MSQETWDSYTGFLEYKDLLIDSNILWTAADNGVVRWDLGSGDYTRYTTKNSNLISDDVNCVSIDGSGDLWFGTSGGVSKFDGTNWTNYTTADGLSDNYISGIVIDGGGDLWFSTMGGISRFDGTNWTIYSSADGLIHNNVNTLIIDTGGNLWFGTVSGVSKFDGTNWTAYTAGGGLIDNYINAIGLGSGTDIWFGTVNGVCKFNGTVWGSNFTTANGLAANDVKDVIRDSNGVIWFVTWNGVCRYDGTFWTSYSTGSGLVNNRVNAVFRDGSVLWFAAKEGVSKYSSPNWTTYETIDALPTDTVVTVLIDPSGNTWFGTSGGASKFDGTGWITYTTADGLVNNDVLKIEIDEEDDLWFGTPGGVSKFDGTNWTNYTTADGLVNNTVNAIAVDPDSNLWFGTSGGVSKFDGTNWTNYTTADGLVNNSVNTIAVYPDSNLWFGTSGGVSKFDGTNWTNYTTADGLVNNQINSITVDYFEYIWFGTPLGVSKFDGTNWITYNTGDGLVDNSVNYITADPNGNIFFSTQNGLSKFDYTNWTTYTISDSLIDNYVNSSDVDSNGNKWFATNGGASFMDDGSANRPKITSSALSDATENIAYSDLITASYGGAFGSLTFEIPRGPSWLSASNNGTAGVLSGTPGISDIGSGIELFIRVHDPAGLGDIARTTINVIGVSDPPVFNNVLADTSIYEGSIHKKYFSVTDSDGDALNINVEPLVKNIDIDVQQIGSTAYGIITWMPSYQHAGIYEFLITADDGTGYADTASYTLTVIDTNAAPVFVTQSMSNAVQDIPYLDTLTVTYTSSIDLLTFTILSGPDWLTVTNNGSACVLSGVPTYDDIGLDIQLSIRVWDQEGLSDTLNTIFDVIDINDPPVFTEILTDTEIYEGTEYNKKFKVRDVDEDHMRLSFLSSPDGMTIHAMQQNDTAYVNISWIPTYQQSGLHEVVIQADDRQGRADTMSYEITVIDLKTYPYFITDTLFHAIEDRQYTDTLYISYIGEIDSTDVGIVSAPEWLTVERYGNACVLSGTPGNDDVGENINVSIKVMNHIGASDTLITRINVINVNDAPEFITTSLGNAVTGTVYNFVLEAIDIDQGDTLYFSLIEGPGWLSVDTATGVLNGSPTSCQNETYDVSLTVFDMEGSSDTLNTILNLIEHKMHFQFTDSTSDGCRIEINSVEIEGEQPEQCDEIGIFEITSAGDTVCIGASVLNGDFPLTVYAWKDDPNTGVVDGYTPGSDMIFRLYDSSTKIEYNTSAGYIQGDGTYSDGTHSIVSNLITTSKIGYVITGLTDETNEVIFTDNSLPVYLNLPDEIFLSINFLSGSLSGQTLSVTQLSSVSDELPEEQQFENPVSIFDISFDLEDFSASLTFRYSDSILNALGISEDDLAVSFYDSLDERGYIWHTVSYDIDEDENLIVLNTEHFSLWAITSNAESIITSVDEENPHNIPVPDTPELRQNYPNPFNPVTRIEYRLSRADRVTVTIYNVLGQEIARLVNSYQPAGLHTVRWDASGVASGTYLYRIVSGDFTAVKKMVVIK